ncbi:hypothetical protein, partial [Faecalispora jeddahensis]|uniref:hypothetical protein n=1 Tax=Faecalispora jeddahensis TaxID=1414721 RepID=UPI0019D5177B
PLQVADRTSALRRRQKNRALPAYEEPPALPGGNYFLPTKIATNRRINSNTSRNLITDFKLKLGRKY